MVFFPVLLLGSAITDLLPLRLICCSNAAMHSFITAAAPSFCRGYGFSSCWVLGFCGSALLRTFFCMPATLSYIYATWVRCLLLVLCSALPLQQHYVHCLLLLLLPHCVTYSLTGFFLTFGSLCLGCLALALLGGFLPPPCSAFLSPPASHATATCTATLLHHHLPLPPAPTACTCFSPAYGFCAPLKRQDNTWTLLLAHCHHLTLPCLSCLGSF